MTTTTTYEIDFTIYDTDMDEDGRNYYMTVREKGSICEYRRRLETIKAGEIYAGKLHGARFTFVQGKVLRTAHISTRGYEGMANLTQTHHGKSYDVYSGEFTI